VEGRALRPHRRLPTTRPRSPSATHRRSRSWCARERFAALWITSPPQASKRQCVRERTPTTFIHGDREPVPIPRSAAVRPRTPRPIAVFPTDAEHPFRCWFLKRTRTLPGAPSPSTGGPHRMTALPVSAERGVTGHGISARLPGRVLRNSNRERN
jgi:hypothetical protein